MKDIYNYNENINVTATPNGDKVVTMNKEIFTTILCAIYDSSELHRNEGRLATSQSMIDLFKALSDKEEQ